MAKRLINFRGTNDFARVEISKGAKKSNGNATPNVLWASCNKQNGAGAITPTLFVDYFGNFYMPAELKPRKPFTFEPKKPCVMTNADGEIVTIDPLSFDEPPKGFTK